MGIPAVSDDEPRLWEDVPGRPPPDPTPIESGGAVLVLTLSPLEVAYLLELGVPDLVTGIHRVLDEEEARERVIAAAREWSTLWHSDETDDFVIGQGAAATRNALAALDSSQASWEWAFRP
jgi:hypothetical protein